MMAFNLLELARKDVAAILDQYGDMLNPHDPIDRRLAVTQWWQGPPEPRPACSAPYDKVAARLDAAFPDAVACLNLGPDLGVDDDKLAKLIELSKDSPRAWDACAALAEGLFREGEEIPPKLQRHILDGMNGSARRRTGRGGDDATNRRRDEAVVAAVEAAAAIMGHATRNDATDPASGCDVVRKELVARGIKLGYYLEATYPVRSDETKGENASFGSQKIEYDIIHVCRKRTEEPKPVSWGRMRREVMADVRQLQAMLENHAKEGLPAADIQVIRRGKALEYFSRHYGKVYVDEGRAISVKDALVGINQLIDEDADKGKEVPPVTAEPMSRQFLRTFDSKTEIARDQLQKFLRGSIITPDEFVQRGWCSEKNKVFTLVDPLDFARDWQGKHKRKLTSDLDQALVLIGACFDGSGINAADTLKNENFKPHAALKALLEWLGRRGATQQTRNAASRALSIYNNWAASHQQQVQQMSMFFGDDA